MLSYLHFEKSKGLPDHSSDFQAESKPLMVTQLWYSHSTYYSIFWQPSYY